MMFEFGWLKHHATFNIALHKFTVAYFRQLPPSKKLYFVYGSYTEAFVSCGCKENKISSTWKYDSGIWHRIPVLNTVP